MIERSIQRNARKLARTRFCHETRDGGININVDLVHYEVGPDRIADAPAFAETWEALSEKRWFAGEVVTDFVNVVTARWLAKARGWI